MTKKKSVYIGLSADSIHHGHMNLLNEGKKYGDIIIGLFTDKAIASFKRLPYLNFEQRKKILMNFKGVVKVVPQEHHDYSKNLLKKAVAGVIPDEIIHREKMGFTAPMAQWLRGDFGKLAETQILGSKLLQDYGFNRDYLTSLLKDHQRKRVDRSLLIWTLFNLATWHARWCE